MEKYNALATVTPANQLQNLARHASRRACSPNFEDRNTLLQKGPCYVSAQHTHHAHVVVAEGMKGSGQSGNFSNSYSNPSKADTYKRGPPQAPTLLSNGWRKHQQCNGSRHMAKATSAAAGPRPQSGAASWLLMDVLTAATHPTSPLASASFTSAPSTRPNQQHDSVEVVLV